MYVRLLVPPTARFCTLIFVVSKNEAIGFPQPHWPLLPLSRPLRTVESPISHNVGRFVSIGGLCAGNAGVVAGRVCERTGTAKAVTASSAVIRTDLMRWPSCAYLICVWGHDPTALEGVRPVSDLHHAAGQV